MTVTETDTTTMVATTTSTSVVITATTSTETLPPTTTTEMQTLSVTQTVTTQLPPPPRLTYSFQGMFVDYSSLPASPTNVTGTIVESQPGGITEVAAFSTTTTDFDGHAAFLVSESSVLSGTTNVTITTGGFGGFTITVPYNPLNTPGGIAPGSTVFAISPTIEGYVWETVS